MRKVSSAKRLRTIRSLIGQELRTKPYPLFGFRSRVKVPKNIELIIALIRQELKSRALFDHLEKVSFNTDLQPNIDRVILFLMGIDDGSDEIFDIYFKIIDRHSNRVIICDDCSLTERALKVYHQVLNAAKKRLIKTNATS